jgi:hypothetical protein
MEKVLTHPKMKKYKNYEDYDFAIAVLKDTLEFSHTIRPICLPEPHDDFSGRFAVVAGFNEQISDNLIISKSSYLIGWGKLLEEANDSSRLLQETRVQILSTEECIEQLVPVSLRFSFEYNNESMVCAYVPHSDACQVGLQVTYDHVRFC